MFREHEDRSDPDRGCWWFSGTPEGQNPEGRFDLPLPRGTFYLAETAVASALERCGRYLAQRMPIPVTAIEKRVVSTVIGQVNGLGDFTHTQSAAIGVTSEIGTVGDYPLTATWALGAFKYGLPGVKYHPRFSPGPDSAFALFGDAGAHRAPGLSVAAVRTLAEILAEAGFVPRLIPSEAEAADDEADDIDSR